MNIFHYSSPFRYSCQLVTLLAFALLLATGPTFAANDQGTPSTGNQKRPGKGIPMNPGEGVGDDTATPGDSKNKTGKAGKNSTKQPRIRRINLVSMPNMRWVKGKRPRFIEKKIRKLEVYGP